MGRKHPQDRAPEEKWAEYLVNLSRAAEGSRATIHVLGDHTSQSFWLFRFKRRDVDVTYVAVANAGNRVRPVEHALDTAAEWLREHDPEYFLESETDHSRATTILTQTTSGGIRTNEWSAEDVPHRIALVDMQRSL